MPVMDRLQTLDFIELEDKYGAHNYHPLDVVIERAEGVWVYDVEGNRYLDCLSARGASNQGHTHTRIAAAMVEQCLRLPLAPPAYRNDRLPPFLGKLCTLTGFEAALALCGDSGALEAAILAARRWACQEKGLDPGRAEILVFSGNGHASGLLGLASAPADQGRFLPGFRQAAYGDLASTRAMVGPGTCAILVEPIQGREVRVPPRGFLRGLRDLCDGEGLLLLADETQSGLCRTGKLFAFEHESIRPDGVLLGQSLSGGFYPVSAFLASRELLDQVPNGAWRSLFAGSPLACAVASAALDVLTDERLADRSAELGAYFLARLRAMESSRIKEIRGLGLWAGLELVEPEAGPLCVALAHEGLLCEKSSESVLTLCPPLVITREQLDWALEKLERVLGR